MGGGGGGGGGLFFPLPHCTLQNELLRSLPRFLSCFMHYLIFDIYLFSFLFSHLELRVWHVNSLFMKLWGLSDFVIYTQIFVASFCFIDGSHSPWQNAIMRTKVTLWPLNTFYIVCHNRQAVKLIYLCHAAKNYWSSQVAPDNHTIKIFTWPLNKIMLSSISLKTL